ncbi:MAG: mechanosensitive ion channel domain-containing protein [Pseudomonadota bacterium]
MEETEITEDAVPTEGAEQVPVEVTEQALAIVGTITRFGERLFSTWGLYQILIIAGLIAASLFVAYIARPLIREALNRIDGLPKWLLRIYAVLIQKMELVLFAGLSWGTYVLMQELTWPSRSFFIGIAASLGLAWALIAILTRFIRNRSLRKLVAILAWIYTTLYIVGLWDDTTTLLDSVALNTGEIRVSVLMVLTAILTLAVLVAAASFTSKITAARIARAEDIQPSIKVLITKAVQLLLFGTAIVVGLRAVGFDLSSLALLSGAIGVGIGFGLQKIVSNLISGIIILLDKSIKPGDVISLGETFGWITQLGARYASVETRDGREYLIPNEDFITNQVVNWSHSNDRVRLDIYFGVSYDSDPHVVKKIASEAPLKVSRVSQEQKPVCHIVNFGDSSIDFILRFWIKDPTGGLTNIRGNVYLALWDALKENQIEIPFPRRDVAIINQQTPPTPPIAD